MKKCSSKKQIQFCLIEKPGVSKPFETKSLTLEKEKKSRFMRIQAAARSSEEERINKRHAGLVDLRAPL